MSGDGGGGVLFSRDELTHGLPARRAGAILFAIEARTARLLSTTRISRATYVGQRAAARREEAFLQSLAAGRDLPLRPTAHDLERFAPEWAELVPENAESRAALAILLAGKYRVPAGRVPQLRRFLGLDDPSVAAAIERQSGAPAQALFASLTPGERFAWTRAELAARAERLPPFWVAYALALTETITEGILVLPIAVAGLGPVGGVLALVALGILNLVTLAALVEAITRNGSMRYGSAYFGRLVDELLGRAGSVSLSVALGIFSAVVLLVYLLGFSSVLRGATGIPEEAWVVLLVLVNLWVLRRETLDETVATALVIGAANIGLILVITGLAFAHFDPVNLGGPVAGAADAPFDPLVIELVFGVIIVSYFGHTSAANASKLILGRDPTGNALLGGNLAALGTVIVLYVLIVVAFAGALGPEPLLGTRGTAITPLAEQVGPIVDILGSVYVVLAVGLGSLYCSLGLYNQVVEMLPRASVSRDSSERPHPLATRPGRYLAGVLPTLLVFALLEYLLLTDQDWFARPIALVGVLTIPLLGGVVPMLLVVAARRRGEYVPGIVLRIVGHPATAIGVSAVFLAGIALHGFVIWTDPVERAAALVIGAGTLGLVAWSIGRGALRRSAVIEVRSAEAGASMGPGIAVVAAGRPVAAPVRLESPGGASSVVAPADEVDVSAVRRATVEYGAEQPREVRVWTHRVTADGDSIPIPARVEIDGETGGGAASRGDGAAPFRLGHGPARVVIDLAPAQDGGGLG